MLQGPHMLQGLSVGDLVMHWAQCGDWKSGNLSQHRAETDSQ